MKSLRHIGLAAVLSLGASNVLASEMPVVLDNPTTGGLEVQSVVSAPVAPVIPEVAPLVPAQVAPAVTEVAPLAPAVAVAAKKGIMETAKNWGSSAKNWATSTFTKEKGKQLWTSCKNSVKTGYDTSVEFVGKNWNKFTQTKFAQLIKNNPKTSIAIAAGVILATGLGVLAYKYRAKIAGLFKKADKKAETQKQGGHKNGVCVASVTPMVDSRKQFTGDDGRIASHVNHRGVACDAVGRVVFKTF